MEVVVNKSRLMKDAHRLFRSNARLGWTFARSLEIAWSNEHLRVKAEKVELHNATVRALWAAEDEEKYAQKIELLASSYIAGPARYYVGNRYNGD